MSASRITQDDNEKHQASITDYKIDCGADRCRARDPVSWSLLSFVMIVPVFLILGLGFLSP
jgi:hypothetical protein